MKIGEPFRMRFDGDAPNASPNGRLSSHVLILRSLNGFYRECIQQLESIIAVVEHYTRELTRTSQLLAISIYQSE
jgi:hypothetical protein